MSEEQDTPEQHYAELIVMHEKVDTALMEKLWPVIVEHNNANRDTVTIASNAITIAYMAAMMLGDNRDAPRTVTEDEAAGFADMLGEYIYFMTMQLFMVHQAEAATEGKT